MVTVDIHDAKTHLSKLIEQAVNGEPFIIARAGKPLVKVSAVTSPAARKRLGFLAGQLSVPKDFDRMGRNEIGGMFSGA